METHKIKAPLIRQIGERFAHPVHGELIVAATTWGCIGCVFVNENCGDFDNDRRTTAGTCCSTSHGHDVVFAKPDDYVVFKLTGEWP